MKQDPKYPKFYEVDDVPIRVDLDAKTNEVSGKTWSGHPYPPFKALSEGSEINEAAYIEASKAYEDHLVHKTIDEDQFNTIISKLFGTIFYKDGKPIPPQQ